jgi:hypothetical protein
MGEYQLSATNRQVMGVVGIQACPHHFFLTLPLKTSEKPSDKFLGLIVMSH